MPLPRRQALSDDVYDAIKSQLLSNQLPPGGRINIDELRRDLGVSNTPIRQALSRLEAEGLVVKEPFRGYAASDFLGLERLLQVYELRSVLEPGVAALAAVRRSQDQVEELAGLAVMPQVQPNEELKTVQIAHDMDARFHLSIAECTGNPQLVEHVHRVHERQLPFRYFTRHVSDRSRANEEHLAVVAAIRAGDGPAAEEAMRRHIANAVARVTSRADKRR
ncbi:MAG TPA: GntR family transcriptional regulator [Kineosporiaceae bacterium]|jgi:DNA-binding GntR family transcriptional regulator|nr:GntR family transcriptional regulator [Kineosporiaceae bacterium]